MVILIEDEPQLLELLSAELLAMQLDCACYQDLAAAQPGLQKAGIQLVIADLGAVEGGPALFRVLNQQASPPPVLFLSGNQNVSLRPLFARGAAGFFSKPFARADFIARVDNLICPPSQRWRGKPQPAFGVIETTIEDPKALAWGRYGFALNHSLVDQVPPQENQLMNLPGIPSAKVAVSPVWNAGQESGWLIETAPQGHETVIRHTMAAPATVGIPFSSLI